ncbi:MAG TPA: hypothetical protein PL082_02865 [Tepidiformaceae bacterium]|nr:hypothetical protein [Tepidiformaceae bacterium]
MSWMFRWLAALLPRLSFGGGETGWVEPSNSITRTVLSGAAIDLALTEASPVAEPAEVLALPQREQPATRTARRTRRRRAGRAA